MTARPLSHTYIHRPDSCLLIVLINILILFSKENAVMHPLLHQCTIHLVLSQTVFMSLTLTVTFYIAHSCQTGVTQIFFAPRFCIIVLYRGETVQSSQFKCPLNYKSEITKQGHQVYKRLLPLHQNELNLLKKESLYGGESLAKLGCHETCPHFISHFFMYDGLSFRDSICSIKA